MLTFARRLKITANGGEICKTLIQKCLEKFVKEKKSDQRAQAFFVEDYVHNLFNFIIFHEVECCVVNGKRHQLMSQSKKSLKMKVVLEFSDSGSKTVFRRCSCNIVTISQL